MPGTNGTVPVSSIPLRSKLYWLGGAVIHFCAAYLWLWGFFGPSGDGEGALATVGVFGFDPEAASWDAYYNDWAVWFEYRLPYWIWSLMYTASAGGASWATWKLWRERRPPALGLAGVCGACVFGGPLIQDCGMALGLWSSGYALSALFYQPLDFGLYLWVYWYAPLLAFSVTWAGARCVAIGR